MEITFPVGKNPPSHDEIMDPTPFGAYVFDAFGNLHQIAMPQWCWHYVRWWRKGGYRVAEWIVECDKLRGDYPLEQYIIDGIINDFEMRKEAGQKLPSWLKDNEHGEYV